MGKPKIQRLERQKRTEFKPDIRAANAIIGAIAFLQKTGFAATPRAIRACVLQRCRKPAEKVLAQMPAYLNRGLELGILKRFNGAYKLGEFEIRKKRRRGQKGGAAGRKHVEVIKEADGARGETGDDDDGRKSSTSVCDEQQRVSCL